MRYLLLSDLHSNVEALEAALTHARGQGWERVLVLGDIVGYGPDPNAVVEVLRGFSGMTAVRGNHDKVAAGLEEGETFNAAARVAAEWTRRVLTAESLAFLRALPRGPREFAPRALLSHGTPLDEDMYLLEEGTARRCFDEVPFDLCFFGHSHYPCAFGLDGPRVALQAARGERTTFTLEAGHRYLINPGSLGQPRDRNPRAAYGIYDDGSATVTVHRVAYAVDATRDKILRAGLPAVLGDRLRLGV
jgi:diadenosine tetraphosphatase ApaH/serine/threonine PP2A family protein phosphatase